MKPKFYVKQAVKMTVHHIIFPLIYHLNSFRKVNPKLVLFADAHHDTLPYNMEAMHREMVRRGLDVEDYFCDTQNGLVRAMGSFLKFMKAYAKARYVFICDNYLPVSACNKRKETTVVQLWHACGAFKKFGYDAKDDIPEFYHGNVYKNYDLVTVSGKACVAPFAGAMHLKQEVVKALGVSRTDCYVDAGFCKNCKENFYRTYPEARNKKIVLWAPTFRGNAAAPYIPFYQEMQQLQEKLGEEWFVLTKVHPHASRQYHESNCSISTEKLLPVLDVLITDYSSIFFDFLIFRKPIIFFAPDLQQYEGDRGFYFRYNTLPGCIVYDWKKLPDEIKIEYKEFNADKHEQFRKSYMEACDGEAVLKIINYIM